MTSLLGRGGAITKCLRALPVLGTLAGPLEDRAMCTEVGTEATLKLREEVVTEYEMGFYGQGLAVFLPAWPGLTADKFIAKDSLEKDFGTCMGDGFC